MRLVWRLTARSIQVCSESGEACTAWCSEIGSLTSLDACNSGASSDVREPISLHQTYLGFALFHTLLIALSMCALMLSICVQYATVRFARMTPNLEVAGLTMRMACAMSSSFFFCFVKYGLSCHLSAKQWEPLCKFEYHSELCSFALWRSASMWCSLSLSLSLSLSFLFSPFSPLHDHHVSVLVCGDVRWLRPRTHHVTLRTLLGAQRGETCLSEKVRGQSTVWEIPRSGYTHVTGRRPMSAGVFRGTLKWVRVGHTFGSMRAWQPKCGCSETALLLAETFI